MSEFTTTSQNPRQIKRPTKPIEEKINNVKTHLAEYKMDYDIVEVLETFTIIHTPFGQTGVVKPLS